MYKTDIIMYKMDNFQFSYCILFQYNLYYKGEGQPTQNKTAKDGKGKKMKANTILEAMQREYYIAKNLANAFYKDFTEESNRTKADILYNEYARWYYVVRTLKDLLCEFGVEVVS